MVTNHTLEQVSCEDPKRENRSVPAKQYSDTEPLIRCEVNGELCVALSLYRILLEGHAFYVVLSSGLRDGRRIAAEMLGDRESEARRIFQMLVRGSVPPETLREIVADVF